MIPKVLWMIWLGDSKPKYSDFSFKIFKEVNPNFTVNFIEWKISDIENPKDEILKNSIEQTLKYRNENKLNSARPFIASLSDTYKFKLISRYGGIYLDCDTFPVRPCDDELLNHTEFYVTLSRNNNSFIEMDGYFFGKCPSDLIKSYPQNKVFLYPHTRTDNCTLKYGEFYGDERYYINHYHDFTWNPGNCRTERCKYDA